MAQNPFSDLMTNQAPRQKQGVVVRDPYRAREEERKDTSTALEAERLRLSQSAEARQREQMNKAPEGYRWLDGPGSAVEFIPGGPADPSVLAAANAARASELTAEQKGAQRGQYGNLINLVSGVTNLRKQYEDNFKGKSPGEYLPGAIRPANAVFDATSGGLNAFIATALGLTGQQFNTPAEQKLFIGSILPNASDPDEVIVAKLDNLDALIGNAHSRGRQMLGYTDENDPLLENKVFRDYLGRPEVDLSGARGPASPSPAPIAGGDSSRSVPIPPEMQQELDQYLSTHPRGSLDAQDWYAFRSGLNQKYGFPAQEPGSDDRFVRGYNEQRGAIDTRIPGPEIPASAAEQAIGSAFDNQFGAGALSYGNAALGGIPGAFADDQSTQAMRDAYGGATLLGDIGGGITGTLLTGGALAKGAGAIASPVAQALMKNPLTADILYGTIFGGNSADSGDEVAGALAGGLGGLVGGGIGTLGGRGLARLRDDGSGLSGGERTIMEALGDTRGEAVDKLQQGVDLGVPLSLSDVSRPVHALTGASMRRAPGDADPLVQALTQRSRGQYDRFQGAIERDLGPIENVPQLSDDLIAKARADAGPLYDEAYANPVISTPEIESLLATPFGRQALGRARTIAANERRNPEGLGFALDPNGDVVLNPSPIDAMNRFDAARNGWDAANAAVESVARRKQASLTPGALTSEENAAYAALEAANAELDAAKAAFNAQPRGGTVKDAMGYTTQTLDYTKRGMDDVLEKYRNPITGRLVLDEAGKAENSVLRSLLNEVDSVNPAYGQARSVYAGPASQKDALLLGQDMVNMSPDNLGMAVGNLDANRAAQARLGFQSQLAENAGKVRNNANPFGQLDTPAMEQRLSSLYSDSPDSIARLLAQRDLEGMAAGSTNRLIGNSATAERGIADKALEGSGFPEDMALGAVETAATGTPLVSMLRMGLKAKVGDMAKLGFGRSADQRAREILPLGGGTDTADVIAQVLALGERYDAAEALRALRAEQAAKYGGALVGGATVGGLAPRM